NSDIEIKIECYITALVYWGLRDSFSFSPSENFENRYVIGYPLKARTQEINSDNGDLIKEKDITIEKSDIEEALYEMIMS
ncbi:hypothetical protein IBE34_10000, partial [Francisella philomiragia]|uniref:hypothetical protein n=1 Tax=Francisella philomiragia TaxID=28110 RepID=UPI001902E880